MLGAYFKTSVSDHTCHRTRFMLLSVHSQYVHFIMCMYYLSGAGYELQTFRVARKSSWKVMYVQCPQTKAITVDMDRSYPGSWQVYGYWLNICCCYLWGSSMRILVRRPSQDDSMALSRGSIGRYYCRFLSFFLNCAPKVKHVF